MRFIIALLLTCASTFGASEYTQKMFRRGLYEPGVLVTTTPLYVLITVRDPRDGSEREAAIVGPFLLGAIDMEYHLDRRGLGHRNDLKASIEQQRKEIEIAFARSDRVFTFRNSKARKNVEPRYTPEILREVRGVLASKSRSQLLAATRASESWLHRIYESKEGFDQSAAYQDAVAHVLLEHGILVGQSHMPTGLFVAR